MEMEMEMENQIKHIKCEKMNKQRHCVFVCTESSKIITIINFVGAK